ncbi:MAG: efflux RND transporter periplasmic adaptor subunit [Methylophilus sp.]
MSHHLIKLSIITSIMLAQAAFAGVTQKSIVKNYNEINLPSNSSQLAYLKVEDVKEIVAPTSDPLNGKITFDENYTSRIGTPIDGRITKINVQVGDYVKAGQALMYIDAPELGNSLADSRKAEAELALKKSVLARNKMLFDGGVIAKKEVENSQSELASAEAEATRANDKLKNLGTSSRTAGEGYAVRAPIAGFIIDRQANPGALVRADAPNPMFIISNPEHLWASIDLPERDLSKVNKNQKVSIQVDAYPNEIFDGQVLSIGQMVDPTTRRIQVRCVVNGKGKLKPEMYAKITPLSFSANKVIRIPNTALITEGLYSYVFIETSPRHMRKQKVELSAQNLDFVIVSKGLKSGDRVVTSGAILLNSQLLNDH